MSVTLKCPKHPRYTAKLAPRANCNICEELWNLKTGYEEDRRYEAQKRQEYLQRSQAGVYN